ncbi:MAG: hypothetical protein GTN36_03325 [Candidatus Aenigmarchaeota archaeon]|nr:hypothetical protein [Candidatus Aenigmarchaeota archaeon]
MNKLHLTPSKEISYFQGNARRNLGKVERSGVLSKIVRYVSGIHDRKNSKSKPLKLKIQSGNPEDLLVLLESMASQHQREEFQKRNKVPKGHTRPQKLGSGNYAISMGCNSRDAASCISRRGNVITISPEAAERIVGFAQEY